MHFIRPEASFCPLTTQPFAGTGSDALLADNRCKMPGSHDVSVRMEGVGKTISLSVGISVLSSYVILCTLVDDAQYLTMRIAPCKASST